MNLSFNNLCHALFIGTYFSLILKGTSGQDNDTTTTSTEISTDVFTTPESTTMDMDATTMDMDETTMDTTTMDMNTTDLYSTTYKTDTEPSPSSTTPVLTTKKATTDPGKDTRQF